MTYKEFKDYVESKGVTNDTEMYHYDNFYGGIGRDYKEEEIVIKDGYLLLGKD